MSIYTRGRALEYRVRDQFQQRGWFVLRSAGSHTPVDVAAFAPGQSYFIQCKASTSPSISGKERVALETLEEQLDDVQCLIAYMRPRGGVRYCTLWSKEEVDPWHQQ